MLEIFMTFPEIVNIFENDHPSLYEIAERILNEPKQPSKQTQFRIPEAIDTTQKTYPCLDVF